MIFNPSVGSGGGDVPYIVGTYVGSSSPMVASPQTIPLDFTPSAVLVSGDNTCMVKNGTPNQTWGLRIIENGFVVGENGTQLNTGQLTYAFIAFK